jgi:N-acyl-D-aspartate/D-glutamate deacylase
MKEAVWLRRFAQETGRPITFTLTQQFGNPRHWKEILQISREAAEDGADMKPQSLGRPVGVLVGLNGRHPFEFTPLWKSDFEHLSLAEKVERMNDPKARHQLIDEAQALPRGTGGLNGFGNARYAFALTLDGDKPDYEPEAERSISAVAAREGRPEIEVFYDLMLEHEGRQLIFRPISNYQDYDLEVVREMLTDRVCSLGLSDAGAHVRSICDGSQPTFMLTHWTRDRLRGERLPLEFVVRKQTLDTATLYGLYDRGVLKPGFRADVNVIDYKNLTLGMPETVSDLPAGGSRFMQKANGYDYTIVRGEVTIEKGRMTGAHPGRLMRGEQHLSHIYRQAALQA